MLLPYTIVTYGCTQTSKSFDYIFFKQEKSKKYVEQRSITPLI